MVTLSLSECRDEGLVLSALCVLLLKTQEACIEGKLVGRHPILGMARGRARANLATRKVVIRKALEGERGESNLISIGRLVYVQSLFRVSMR